MQKDKHDRQDEAETTDMTEDTEVHTGDDTSVTEDVADAQTDTTEAADPEGDAGVSREDELKDQLMRLQADFTNYRRRAENEKREYASLGSEKVLLELLNIVDNFERALAGASGDEKFREGVELIYAQLLELLKRYNVEAIDGVDVPFDHNIHHAVLVEAREGVKEDTVLDILQKGYKINDKILRPAMVKVSQ
ncbi:nucleotide exchange factor GrpE [Peptoniphilus equinus]|uniref:Protein GrpE n=1 Tax=Peptoniphilus equinus TaxID=3016343 RepID=A0ABY7QVX9_9FIRM|nr:nucleotide exchange factor GrpE [Peptoniphilus equinus]WBW50363.1 nucleotide exchange factor GrpE [Peptoniphilus equinus]